MNKWFSKQIDQSFTLFGESHLTMLMVFLIGNVLILSFANPLKTSSLLHNTVRILLLCLLVISEISYQLWAVTNGLWSDASHLPLHLCGMASILGAWALITYNLRLIKANYFIGVVPAALALVTPDLLHDYPHFRFWKFFLHHMAISWTSLFLVLTVSLKMTWKDLWHTFTYLILYAVLINFLNSALGTNYLYLNGPPITGTPLDWLGEGFSYYLHLGSITFLVFLLQLIFYKFFQR